MTDRHALDPKLIPLLPCRTCGNGPALTRGRWVEVFCLVCNNDVTGVNELAAVNAWNKANG